MQIGMLWYDNDPELDLLTKVEHAANYYSEKYGHVPTICCAKPETLGDNHPEEVAGIRLQPMESVLPDHFWIGTSRP